MADASADWLRRQWSNPTDIFTILLIVGGDIVRVAVAQLCAGPVPYFTPVSFSFGWVTYAVTTMLSAFGETRLMPAPEAECLLINAETGYRRRNCSWVISRMLRDFDYWSPAECNRVEAQKLNELRTANEKAWADYRESMASGREVQKAPPPTSEIRLGLRVTVWQCESATGVGQGDLAYWCGIAVTIVQLGIAAVPWGLYNEWFIFFVTASGTALAYASGALAQWPVEKCGVRKLEKKKDVLLTGGNGAHDVVLILGCVGGLDLEALAAPQREIPFVSQTRAYSIVLAALWIALLLSVAGWQLHTWYLIGVGFLGMLHNVAVAGIKRQPQAFGIHLAYRETIVEGKVMEVLRQLEEKYPQSGASLLDEFFPGKLFPRESAFWAYAARRSEAYKQSGRKTLWPMPPLRRPPLLTDDLDIPPTGPYESGETAEPQLEYEDRPQASAIGKNQDNVVEEMV